MNRAQPPASLWSRVLPSPVGPLHGFVSDAGIRALLWERPAPSRPGLGGLERAGDEHPLLDRLASQLDEYFAGGRRSFDLPLDPVGTAFQREAWRALCAIPYGDTRTYGQQAVAIGRPRAVRAIGAANGRNPISIVVPCHRVVGANGSLTGFAGGLDVKRRLLELESND